MVGINKRTTIREGKNYLYAEIIQTSETGFDKQRVSEYRAQLEKDGYTFHPELSSGNLYFMRRYYVFLKEK